MEPDTSYKIFTSAADAAASEAANPASLQIVSFSQKSTEKNKVPDNEKFRCAIIPVFPTVRVYDVANSDDVQPQDVFKQILAETFADAAGGILKSYWLADKARTSIPADLLTFAAIVSSIQAAQDSERLNSDMIAEWYDGSTMPTAALVRYEDNKEKAVKLRKAYLSLASNNPGISAELAARMLTYLEGQEVTHSIFKAVTNRLAKLMQVSVNSNDL